MLSSARSKFACLAVIMFAAAVVCDGSVGSEAEGSPAEAVVGNTEDLAAGYRRLDD